MSQIKPSSLNSPPSRLAPQDSGPADCGVAEFEALYRANVAAVTAYFARRSAEPQTVADLTADTFVQAITSFATFDLRKGTPRAWVFGIARRIYAAHCQANSQHPSVSVGTGVNKNGHRSVTVKVGKGGIPAGDTMILAFSGDPRHGTALGAGGIITGPVPSCVSLPSAPSGRGRLRLTSTVTRAG